MLTFFSTESVHSLQAAADLSTGFPTISERPQCAVENLGLPTFFAETFFPLKSKVLMPVNVLAHNFVHKNCGEKHRTPRGSMMHGPATFFSTQILLR